ncbi:hypothetical protein HDU96_001459, partial [Phlyctochytrium bullatum]
HDSAVHLPSPVSPDGLDGPKALPDWQKAIVQGFLDGGASPDEKPSARTRRRAAAAMAAAQASASAAAAQAFHHPLPPPAPSMHSLASTLGSPTNSTASLALPLPMPLTPTGGPIRTPVTTLPSTSPYPDPATKPLRGRKPKPASATPAATPALTQDQIDAIVEQQKLRMMQGLTEDMMPCPEVVAAAKAKLRNGRTLEEVAAGELVKKHRGFGASANVFNKDGSKDVGPYRKAFYCHWCFLSGKYTPTLRKGPTGIKSLCNACGIWYGKHGILPEERFQYHADQVVLGIF